MQLDSTLLLRSPRRSYPRVHNARRMYFPHLLGSVSDLHVRRALIDPGDELPRSARTNERTSAAGPTFTETARRTAFSPPPRTRTVLSTACGRRHWHFFLFSFALGSFEDAFAGPRPRAALCSGRRRRRVGNASQADTRHMHAPDRGFRPPRARRRDASGRGCEWMGLDWLRKASEPASRVTDLAWLGREP